MPNATAVSDTSWGVTGWVLMNPSIGKSCSEGAVPHCSSAWSFGACLRHWATSWRISVRVWSRAWVAWAMSAGETLSCLSHCSTISST